MAEQSYEPSGLQVVLDRLVYRHDPVHAPAATPHIFVYFLTILNNSTNTVTLKGRKWVIEQDDGRTLVIEGDKIVGETPRLKPGEKFSYNSFHLCAVGGIAHGSYHGVDEQGRRIHVRIPPFVLHIPEKESK